MVRKQVSVPSFSVCGCTLLSVKKMLGSYKNNVDFPENQE